MRRLLAGLVLLGAAFAPAEAHAHLVGGRLGDFYGGLLHPLTSLEHVVPWLALCLLAGLQAPRVGRWIFLAFPLGLLAGLALAERSPELPFVGAINAASFVVGGVAVALAVRLPAPALAALACLFGAAQGFANGAGLPAGVSPLLFALGVGTAGYAFVAILTAAVTAFRNGPPWRTIAVRAVGSWVAAIGIMLLALPGPAG